MCSQRRARISETRRPIGDSRLELEFASFLENCPDVQSYAKNYLAVGLKLDYVTADGGISNYYPDFVVKLVSGEVWIVETKGREDLNDPGKWERLQQWCEDASKLDAGRQYRALFVREEDWERYKPKTFHDAVAVFAQYPDREATSKRDTEPQVPMNEVLLVQYRRLVDKRYLVGLSETETREMERLGKQIDEANEPFYAPIIERIKLMLREGSK